MGFPQIFIDVFTVIFLIAVISLIIFSSAEVYDGTKTLYAIVKTKAEYSLSDFHGMIWWCRVLRWGGVSNLASTFLMILAGILDARIADSVPLADTFPIVLSNFSLELFMLIMAGRSALFVIARRILYPVKEK
jgi:hypothetical protein